MSAASFFSAGFRPFFLGAAIFGGMAAALWAFSYVSGTNVKLVYVPRDWHVHEMLFGFLPAVIAGFLLTAMPNWTDRPALTGGRLMAFATLWAAGRLAMSLPGLSLLAAAVVDSAFLFALTALLWNELTAGRTWRQAPIGVLLSVYAAANVLFHVRAIHGTETDLPERMALAVVLLLLTLIGGRIIPNFTRELLYAGTGANSVALSWCDRLAILLVIAAVLAWIVGAESATAGVLFIAAAVANGWRLSRWQGWKTWREPLVLVLHVGYGWLVMSLLTLGAAMLGIGLGTVSAVHVLTTGAVGNMTLAVMTRAALGHTGRMRHAGPLTVLLYVLVNVGAVLRVLAPISDSMAPWTNQMLMMAGVLWGAGYIGYAALYGPFLLQPSLDE